MTELAIAEPAAQDVPDEGSPKRRAVLAAATALFMGQGYGATSMEQVARTANVSKATLYAYFASKEALFATIVADRTAQLLVAEEASGEAPDLRDALMQTGRSVLEFMLSEPVLAVHRMAIAESARFPEIGRALYENGPQLRQARFIGWLERQHAAGRVNTPVPRIAAYQFMALLRGCIFLRASLGVAPHPGAAEIEETITAAVDTWLAAYGRPRGAQPAR